MRSAFYIVLTGLLVGCATTTDPVACLVAKLSATHGDWDYWENGIFSVLDLPRTASPEDVIHKLFNMGLPYGETAHYKILKIQQIHIPIAEVGSDLYTAIIVRKDSSDKIVLIKYRSTAVGWWSRVYDL